MAGRTVTAGALIVELRTNAAKFTAEMDDARGETEKLGKSTKNVQRQLEHFAAQGLGAIIPGAEGAGSAIARMVVHLTRMGGVLKTLGTLGVIIGAAYALGRAIQFAGEEFQAWRQTGELTATTLKRINDELAVEKKFLDDRAKSQATMLSLDKQIMTLREDDVGLAKAANREREAMILATTKGADTIIALAKNAIIAEEEMNRARDAAGNRMMERIDAQEKKQLDSWQKETAALITNLEQRTQARAAFEAQLGTTGLGGGPSALAGLREASELGKKIQQEMRDIAFATREGKLTEPERWRELTRVQQGAQAEAERLKGTYAEFPSVLRAVDAAAADVAMGNWTNSLILAESWVRQNIATDQELVTSMAALNAKLAESKPATEGSAEAFAKAAQQAAVLRDQVWGLVSALSAYNQAVAGQGAAAPAQ